MQTLNCLSLKISKYSIHTYICSQKKRCDVTFYWIPFASSRLMGILAHMKSSHIPIPIVTCTLPIPIPILGMFVFPVPWDSDANPMEMGIPFPCISLLLSHSM